MKITVFIVLCRAIATKNRLPHRSSAQMIVIRLSTVPAGEGGLHDMQRQRAAIALPRPGR